MELSVNSGGEEGRGSASNVEVAGKTYDLEAVRWLRTRRSVVSDAAQAAEFQKELQALGVDIVTRRGASVGAAVAITIGAIALAVVSVFAGLFVMDLASGLMGSMSK